MGASISTNTISSMINNSIKVINNYEQTCVVTQSSQDSYVCLNCCTITKGGEIDLLNNQVLNQKCITQASTQTAIAASVQQSMRQQANAVVQQFAFGTVADANNFINASITLADEISNTYNSTCSAAASNQVSELTCNNSVISGVISIENFQSITQSCLLKAITNSTANQLAISALSQSAVAKQQSTFASILFGFAIILAIGAWFLVSIADNELVQWLIVGIVLFSVIGSIIYSLTAKSAGNYPYTKA